MANYLRRIAALEARHSPADLPVIVAFVNDGDDKDAVVADALRERGLKPGETRLMVVRWGKSGARLR